MANSFDVNLTIGSALAFNVVGGNYMFGNAPQMQTVRNLDGQEFTTSSFFAFNGPVLFVDPLNDFITSLYNTSTRQAVNMTNKGNAVLTITGLTYSFSDAIGPRFYYSTGTSLLNSSTITILPGNTATIEVAYISSAQGLYNNYFTIASNNNSGFYRVNTHQIIGTSQGFDYSPEAFNTTTTRFGQIEKNAYNLIPVFNTIQVPSAELMVTGTLVGSPAWTIDSTGTNTISVKFNSNEVGNVNGTYVSTLTIYANEVFHQVTNTATIIIDHAANKNLGGWLSPASHYNSIIGVSYDLEDNQRYLTIGVGMGGDGTPIYGSGGYEFASVENLGLSATHIEQPYPFWANVYRIPFTGAAQTYTSNDYIVKTTDGVDYTQYFGEYGEPGSMFIVEDDGYGSLTIELNHLSSLSEDESVNATLNNLTRAFYYYSDVDTLGRYEPLPAEYVAPIATNTGTTYLFIGFNYNTRDKTSFVNTSIVDLPV